MKEKLSEKTTFLELVEEIAAETGQPAEVVKQVLYAQTEVITRDLQQGHQVQIIHIGVIHPYTSEPKQATIPGTGERMVVPSQCRVGFRTSRTLRRTLNGCAGEEKEL